MKKSKYKSEQIVFALGPKSANIYYVNLQKVINSHRSIYTG